MSSKRVPELASITAQDSLTLTCEWQDCQEVYDDMEGFCDHLERHLREFVPPDVPEDTSMTCKWQECGHEMSSILELVRHVYFHAFHVKIKSHGYTLILKNKWRGCSLDPTSRNTIPDLPERFRCLWTGCSVIFDSADLYYKHVKHHAEGAYPEGNNVPGGCKCQWQGCLLTMKSKHKVKTHLRSHTQEKTVACPTCGSLFSTSTRFMDHIKRQQDCDDSSQYYQCSYCNKRFPSERILKDHMRHHVNHYKCPFCEMTCPSPSNLRMHIDYKHSCGKPHKCGQCNFSAKTANDIRRHTERIHAKSRLKCEVPDCQFKCQNLSEYKHHYRNAHEGHLSPYLCHVCGDHFKRGSRLTEHLKKKHKFKWLPGHSRFRFKQHDDGYYRLQTVRYESVEVPPPDGSKETYTSEQPDINKLSPKRAKSCVKPAQVKQNASESGEKSDATDATLPLKKRGAKRKKSALPYNLEMLGDVALSIAKEGVQLTAKSENCESEVIAATVKKQPKERASKRRCREVKNKLQKEPKSESQAIHHMPTATELMAMWDGNSQSGSSPKKPGPSPSKSSDIWQNFGQGSTSLHAFEHIEDSPEKSRDALLQGFIPEEFHSSGESLQEGTEVDRSKELETMMMNFPMQSPGVAILPGGLGKHAAENSPGTDGTVIADLDSFVPESAERPVMQQEALVTSLVDATGQTVYFTTDMPVSFAQPVGATDAVDPDTS